MTSLTMGGMPSPIDSCFSILKSSEVSLKDAIAHKDQFEPGAFAALSKLYAGVLYPKRGNRNKLAQNICNYNGNTDDMENIIVTRTYAGCRAYSKDHRLIKKVRDMLNHKKQPNFVMYDDIIDYFKRTGKRSLPLSKFFCGQHSHTSGPRFTQDAAAYIAALFAEAINPDDENLENYLSHYNGRIIPYFDKIKIEYNNGSIDVNFEISQSTIYNLILKNKSINIPQTKRCKTCGKILPISDFSRDRYAKDLHKASCKHCLENVSVSNESKIEKVEHIQKNDKSPTITESIQETISENMFYKEYIERNKNSILHEFFTTEELFNEVKQRGYKGEIIYQF